MSKLFSCLDSLNTGLSLLSVSISTFVPVQVDKATNKKKKKRGGKLENGYHLVVPPIKQWIWQRLHLPKAVFLSGSQFFGRLRGVIHICHYLSARMVFELATAGEHTRQCQTEPLSSQIAVTCQFLSLPLEKVNLLRGLENCVEDYQSLRRREYTDFVSRQ